ncbi:hypothetical protein BDQ17DRAFT_1255132, partial [Cyathus striatus]
RFVHFCIQYSSITLLYYDYFLTFSKEVRYIWKVKFRPPTTLYVFCRYAMVANVIYVLAISGKIYTMRVCITSLSACNIC